MKTSSPHSVFQKATAVALLVMILSIAAFASPTLLTTAVLIQNNATVTAGQLTVTPVACDTVDGTLHRDRARDPDSAEHGFVHAQHHGHAGRRSLRRYEHIADQLFLPATSISMVQMKYLIGWTNAGVVTIPACSSNLIKIAVIQYN